MVPNMRENWKLSKGRKSSFNHKSVIRFDIVCEIHLQPYNSATNFALRNSSFGAVKLTKTADGIVKM